MWKYALSIAYCGGAYCGWQKQKKKDSLAPGNQPVCKLSIQETIENALFRMTGESLSVVGSGRTDSGVHAYGQVAHFSLKKKKWESRILFQGLNGLLPRDIRILNVQEVILEFHAQKSVLQKQYSYYFQQGPSSLPHFESYSWWIRKELQVQAMSEALRTLIGKQDYRAFQASGAKPGPTVREILEADVTTEPLPFPSLYPLVDGFALVRVRIVGTGFLKQMVRGIVGTLLQVGEGRRAGSILKEIQETQSRSLVGPTAPARGLWLERVWYPTLFGLNG